MKKTVKVLLTLVVLFIGFGFANTKGNTVLAAETEKEYKTVLMDIEKDKIPVCTDNGEEWLFAGWFEDAKCEVAYNSFPAGVTQAYAKFVPEKVLSVKLQLTEGTNGDSDKTNMRLVSSVDSLDYRKVGFKVYFNGAEKPVDIYTSTVYERIVASAESGVDYNYSPKVVDTDSEYFVTATLLNIKDSNFNKSFYIRPYWITLDGTTVYGENRFVTVEDGYNANIINMPVKMDETSSKNLTVSGVTGASVTLANYDGTYAHVRINLSNVDKTTLKSVTTFTVGDSEVTYRNLETTHVVAGDATAINADTSWYDDYDTEDTFVIATSADLYGLAAAGSKTFSGKTIYVIADIEANKGRADSTGWLNIDEEGNTIEGFTNYLWTSISNFTGVFDGQMHEISGIYLAETNKSAVQGLFATTSATTVIRNLKLINSYFESNGQRLGSIVGEAFGGTLKSVYSDAIVNGSNTNTGGLVGRNSRSSTGTFTMKNCWYAGTANGTGGYAGGLMGSSLYSTNITHCLNTGNVTGTKPIGGLVSNADGGTLSIINSMNSGSVSGSNTQIGGIVGLEGTQLTKATYDSTYMTDESATGAVNGAEKDGVTSITATKITGIKALTAATQALFSGATDEGAYESYWAIVNGGTPVLASFKEFAKVGGNTVGAMAIDTSWYNDTDTEFILSDAADLYGLAFLSQTNNFHKKKIKLNKDITINEGVAANWDTEAPSHNWFPIGRTGGNTQIPRFAGIFDGQMHTISGVYMKSDISQVGMFGNTNADAVIKNLKLVNSYFETEKDSVGSIAGYGYGTFDTIYSDAIVKGGSAWIGGLIGLTHGGVTTNMDNCWFDGEVFQTGEGNETEKACVGGLIGLARNVVTISNCLSTGEISSVYAVSEDPCVGGLVGRVTGANAFTLKNSFDAGTVKVADTAKAAYGPIAGSIETTGETTITDNFAYSENYATDVSTVYDGVTNVSADDILGTDALKKMTKLFTNKVSAIEYDSCWAVVLGDAPVLESFAEVTNKEFLALDTSWYNGNDSYTLNDVGDLYGFALLSYEEDVNGYSGKTISLGDNITINEGTPYGADGVTGGGDDWSPKYEWLSICNSTTYRFAGTFDGNMKTISGVYMNSTKDYSGLFGLTMPSAVVQNFSLTNSYFTSTNQDLGSVIGNARGTIENVYSDAIVISAHKDVGGIVGRVSGSTEFTMTDCWFAGSVINNGNSTGARYTGGLIGSVGAPTTIMHSLNSGKVSAPDYIAPESATNTGSIRPHVGGLVGVADSGKALTVTNCLNAGSVTFNEKATTGYGSIVGNASASGLATLNNTYATASSCEVLSKGNISVTGEQDDWCISDGNSKGTNALSYMMDLFIYENENGIYENHWVVVPGKTPILAKFASVVEEEFLSIDISWYDKKGEYALYDVADFYGFALLSYKTNFADETITLENDIVVNEGSPCGADGIADIDAWKPKYEWVKIGSQNTDDSCRFDGTFDGKMHSISGIYLQTGQANSGLFGLLDEGAVVKNFSLVNSYFNSSARALGSVVGHSRGTIDTIYSNAIVVGNQSNVGGILGQVDGTYGMKSMSNCWFDGTVTNNATDGQSTGGLIGAAIGNVLVENCLNTGAISTPNYARNEGTEEAPSIKPLVGGLLGYVDSAKTVTVQHCLNTGKVSFNSIATTGFGSVIGRIKSRAEGVTEDGNIVVENTYATSQSSWETVSTSDTWSQISVTVVDDNVIGGENARKTMSGLFNEELTSSWVTGVKSPILKDFAKYGSTEKSISGLHRWVTSDESLSATLQNPVTLPNPENVDLADVRRQGGFTDGQYFYQAYITYTDEVTNEAENKVKVLKYDLASGDCVWSDELALNHANDITYNSKLECLVVCHSSPNAKLVSYINVTETGLEFKETVTIDYSISYIDYNEERDVYIAGTSAKFFVLNSDFKKISKDFTPNRVSGEHTGQGVSCDDDYIYFVLSAGTVKTEVIEVYDWSGRFVKTITLDIKTDSETIESENISVVGDKIYIMVAELSDIVGIQYKKPANVYTIDLTETE